MCRIAYDLGGVRDLHGLRIGELLHHSNLSPCSEQKRILSNFGWLLNEYLPSFSELIFQSVSLSCFFTFLLLPLLPVHARMCQLSTRVT